jgi:hypothetical protein
LDTNVLKDEEKNQTAIKHTYQTGNGAILSDADIKIIRIVRPEKFYGDGQTTERGLIPVNIKF